MKMKFDKNIETVLKVDAKAKLQNLDSILVEKIGNFGWYQLRTVIISAIAIVLLCLHEEYLFSAARINTRCLIAECEIATNENDFAPHWISNAIPSTSAQTFDQCQRFATNISLDHSRMPNETCPSLYFDQERLKDCTDYVYESKNSIVYDFNLACDEWRRTLIGTVQAFGALVAMPITGFVSDRWGRRTALAINVFGGSCFGLSRLWAKSYNIYTTLGFFIFVFSGGIFSAAYISTMEVTGPKYRVLLGALIASCGFIGEALLAVLAWAVPHWRNLILVSYTPGLVFIIFWFTYSESIRWYITKGRYDEAEEVLNNISRLNKKPISENVISILKRMREEEKEDVQTEKIIKEPWLITQVFNHKPILIRCFVVPIWWLAFDLVYYGLSINSVNLASNHYVTYAAVSIIALPASMSTYLIMDRIGRKEVLSGAYFICAASQVAYLFVPKDLYGAVLILYLIGKSCIAVVGVTLYLYTSELFPTSHRHTFLSFSSMFGRAGIIIAQSTPAFSDQVPYIIFASLACLSGFLVFITPETLGWQLPDTMEEASNLGMLPTKKKKRCI